MQIKFWGTRGSLPVNAPTHREFGGNTSCVSVHHGDDLVIIDAGSGLIHLAHQLMAAQRRELDLFLSHFHADHVCGLPFFKPLFDPGFHIRLHSFGSSGITLKKALKLYMRSPAFPIIPESFRAKVSYHHHSSEDHVSIGDVTITALPIPHPGGAHAMRLRAGDMCFVYATDTEHTPGKPNQELVKFMRDADLMVYDCTFDDTEFDARRGWGHSTWQEGVRLATTAQVARLAIFHHEPDRTDEELRAIESRAKQTLPQSFVARDFQIINLQANH